MGLNLSTINLQSLLLQRQIFREQAVSRVNLTRFGHTSVDLKHKKDAIQRFAPAAVALDLERIARRAGWVAPAIAREIFAERDLAARLAAVGDIWAAHCFSPLILGGGSGRRLRCP